MFFSRFRCGVKKNMNIFDLTTSLKRQRRSRRMYKRFPFNCIGIPFNCNRLNLNSYLWLIICIRWLLLLFCKAVGTDPPEIQIDWIDSESGFGVIRQTRRKPHVVDASTMVAHEVSVGRLEHKIEMWYSSFKFQFLHKPSLYKDIEGIVDSSARHAGIQFGYAAIQIIGLLGRNYL